MLRLPWIKKKPSCEHEWFELDTKRELETEAIAGIIIESEWHVNTYIYCPKCHTRNKVRGDEWKRIEKAQQIRKKTW